MKYFLHISCFLFILVTSYSCKRTVHGDGAYVSQTRDLNQTSEIELAIPAKLSFIEADSFTCVIVAQQNILEAIKTKADGDEFIIESNRNLSTEKPVQIVISMPQIRVLTINGSGEITGLNSLKDNELELNVNGSGNIKLRGNVNDAISNINGSGAINLSGKCNQQKVNINGSGDFQAIAFVSAETKVEIKGSGDAEVNATEQLRTEINGSGNIRYKGNPRIKSNINGSGSIQKIE